MLKANVGWSIAADSFAAGKEAAEKSFVENNPTEKTQVAYVYGSVDYDHSKLLQGVNEALPNTKVIGCTSYTGVLTPDGFITSDDGYIAVMSMAADDYTMGVAGMPKNKDARETGRAIAKKAMEDAGRNDSPAFFYMVANPAEEEFYLKGIQDIIGRVPFFGGSAADNTVEGKWQVYYNDKYFNDGVAVVFYYTDKKIANYFTGDYKETDKAGIITKVKDNRCLVEIDNEPALKKYAEWRNLDPESLFGLELLGATIMSPLGIKDPIGSLTVIRHPMVGNEDFSMNIGNNLVENTAVIMMESNQEEMISSTQRALEKVGERMAGAEIGAYILVHCGGRRGGLDTKIDEACGTMKNACNGIPFIGVFTFGEYGSEDHSANTCGGLMLSFTGFEK